MSKEQVIKLTLALLAAVIPVVVASFPALPTVAIALLNALAAYAGGSMLHKATPPLKS